jgi:hypothetical protein
LAIDLFGISTHHVSGLAVKNTNVSGGIRSNGLGVPVLTVDIKIQSDFVLIATYVFVGYLTSDNMCSIRRKGLHQNETQ